MMSFIIQKSEYLQQRLPFHYRVSKTQQEKIEIYFLFLF